MPYGKIIWFDPHKLAYGFIRQDDATQRDVFVHKKNLLCDPTALQPDTRVSFDLVSKRDGRLCAQDVRLIDTVPVAESTSSESFSDVVAYCKDSD